MLDAALQYASWGWRVIPVHGFVHTKRGYGCSCGKMDCESPGKHPIPFKWTEAASVDTDTITAWAKRWPYMNVGVVTGAISNLIVLDVDSPKGGDDSLDKLVSENGKLPDTAMVLTGGGGFHYFFKHPGGVVKNRARFYPGLDIRGDGGFVVAAPSLHLSGRNYEWEASSHPEEAGITNTPEWLLSIISKKTQITLCENGTVPTGARNDYLIRLAGAMRRVGANINVIHAALISANQTMLQEALEETEVLIIAKSAMRWEGRLLNG